jgi:hypothetical protein
MTHLSAEDLAAYLDGTLAPDVRREAEAHLADCAGCRSEMLETRRILARSSRTRPSTRVLVPLAAAAIVTTIFLLPSDQPDPGPQLRSDAPTGVAATATLADIPVRPVEFADGIDGSRITLAWDSIGPRLDYRITLTDQSGATMWTGTSTAPRVTLPPDVALGEDSIFFWFVDATLTTGEAATSGIQEFRTR